MNRLTVTAGKIGGNCDEAGQDLLGNLHTGELALTALGVADQSCHIQAQIAHEREGMRRINSQGCENRKDRCLEVVVNPESLALIELFVIQQMGAVVSWLFRRER